ncbi:MAG: hypothetical protein OXF08_02635 [Bacteroidetes bacterium]|nr:hypothetical protein [Bacteroidota bacterium]
MTKPLTDFSKEDLKHALQWAKEGASFDHVKYDVPEAARAWVSERIELVREMFHAQNEFSDQWLQGEIGLSDIEQPFRETFTGWIREALAYRKEYYERHKDKGITDYQSRKRSKKECQEAFAFLASGQPVGRLNDLPSALRTDVDLDSGLEVHTRHLEKKREMPTGLHLGSTI